MTDTTLKLDNIDLSTFGKRENKTVQDIVDSSVANRAKATRQVAVTENPQQHAQALKSSKETGLPLETVKSDPNFADTQLKLNQIDFNTLSSRNPKTAKFLTDTDNAILAQNDTGILSTLEDIFDFSETFSGLGESIKLGFQKQGEGFMLLGADTMPKRRQDIVPMFGMPVAAMDLAPSIGIETAENLGIMSDEELAEATQESIEKSISEIVKINKKRDDLTPDDLNTLEQGVRSGVESLVMMAPGLAATVLTRGVGSPMLISAGSQTYLDSYAEGRAGGLSKEQANFYATVDAAIEVGTEVLPTRTLEGIIGGQFKGELSKATLQFAIREMGTEQLATLGQSLNAYANGLDEQLENAETVEEMIQIQGQRQVVTAIATVVAGGAQAGIANSVSKTAEYLQKRTETLEQRGEREQEVIDIIAENSSESELRSVDQERFFQFVEENDGDNNSQVYIDGTQLSLYLKEVEGVRDDPALEILRARVEGANIIGADVTVPVAEFATYIAGTDHFKNLREFMTMSAETVAPFRQDEARQELDQQMGQMVEKAQENISQYVEAQDIFEDVRTQLVESGVYSASNASTMARVVPAWATVYAEENGISVREAYEKSGLIVQGPQTDRSIVLTGDELEQRVFHGTPHQFSKFSLESIGSGEGAQAFGWGLYFTNKKEIADFYKSSVSYKQVVDEFKKESEDFADFEEIIEAIENKKYPPKMQSLLEALAKDDWLGFDYPAQAITSAFRDLDQFDPSEELLSAVRNYGETREVEIPEDVELLDYDKPLNEQSDYIQSSIAKSDLFEFENETGREIYKKILEINDSNQKATSLYFNEIGIPGLRYKAGQIAGTKTDGINFVIWDDSRITEEIVSNQLIQAEELFQKNVDPSQQVTKGYYAPSQSMIRLTEAADLSTFLHEFAHFMYEMELVSNNPAKLQKVYDWIDRNALEVAKEATKYTEIDFIESSISQEDIKQYTLNGSLDDKAKDTAVRRAVHEWFARGFETYLMEGKAPSVELRNIFATFARWLSQIYKQMAGGLRVNLDDQMRDVFDRLLATEEQLEAARARAQYEPMFTDAAMAGMTQREFERYQDRIEKAKNTESETLRDKLVKEITRQTESWWNTEKNDIADEQKVILRNKPVFRATAAMKGGEIKLDRATVKQLYGVKVKDKNGREYTKVPDELRNMTVTGAKGVHPDQAAAFFGFTSGDEMIREITMKPNLEDTAEANARSIMLERHGDILNDGTIERLADEALQNDSRGEVLLAELKALAKEQRIPVLNKQAIKSLAEENIAKLSFREIHPEKYRRAQVRAARESGRLLAQGDRQGATQAKSREVMNYYLALAATNAKNETIKIVDNAGRYSKKQVRQEIIKAGVDYWQQIEKILERFEFRKSATIREVNAANQAVQSVNTWMANKINYEGDGLVLSSAVLNEPYRTHWKNVPFSELQGINDSLKNIEHVARYSNRITRAEETVQFDKLVNNWINHMNQQPDVFKAQRTDTAEGRNFGRWAMGQMTKIPWMASWLDGGERVGLSHQILVQPFTEAYKQELDLWRDVGDKVAKAIENRSKATLKRHNKKYFIPEIKDQNNDGNLYGHQILAVALNTGNQSNLRKLLLGEGWATEENEATIRFENPKLQAVLQHMTKEDWDLVQLIWDQMELLYPKLAETHRRTTGLEPPKIQATKVETPFGDFKGGYYPVKYDSERSHQADLNEEKLTAQVESMFNTMGSIQASVNAGATNERTRYYAPIKLNLGVIPNHFQETIHYITHHDPVRETNKLIRNQQVADTIKKKLGKEEYKQLAPWLNDIAKDGRATEGKTFWEDTLQRLRFGLSLGVMGFKASTGLIQISGLSNSIAEVGVKNMSKSVRMILGSVSDMRSAWDFAVSNSQVLEFRAKTMDREIKNAMNRIQNKTGFMAAVQEASMKHIALIQTYSVDLPSWHAAYLKAMDEHGDQTKAFQYADWVIENVQGSGATKDLPSIMRNQRESIRMFTMFMTFFSALWNNQRDLARGAKSGKYSVTTVAAKAMFLFVIPVIFESFMRGELGPAEDEEPEEALQRMLTRTAMYPIQTIPFARDVANAATGEFGYNISPIAGLIEKGVQSSSVLAKSALTDDEITKSQVKGTSQFAGALLGVPGTYQAWATGEHLYDVIEEGEELTVRELLFGPERD